MPTKTVKTIPITKTYFDETDIENIIKPLQSGWVAQGQYVSQFEEKFREYTKAPYAAAVSSCSTALHLSLAALGIKPGDEVIVPSFTWIATANAAEHLGAIPVFCDIDLDSYNIDINLIEEKITPQTKAIIPVHLFGLPAKMDAIKRIADKYDLRVVEDAACGFGAYYNNKHVGNFGDIGCFSFHPRKAITTGEGGMLTTSDAKLDALFRALRNHGATISDFERHNSKTAFLLSEYKYLGYNYRMTDIQGALGVSQIEKADWIQSKRLEKAKYYDQLLADVYFLKRPQCPENMIHGYQSYVCLFQPEPVNLNNVDKLNRRRNELMVKLEENGISTRQGTHAVTLQQYYQKKYGITDNDYPIANIADRLTIALPLYPQMTEEDQEYVVENLKRGHRGEL
jgi:perosamine synthetase